RRARSIVASARLRQAKAAIASLNRDLSKRSILACVRRNVHQTVGSTQLPPDLFIKPYNILEVFGEQDFPSRIVHQALHVVANSIHIELHLRRIQRRSRPTRQGAEGPGNSRHSSCLEGSIEIPIASNASFSVFAIGDNNNGAPSGHTLEIVLQSVLE